MHGILHGRGVLPCVTNAPGQVPARRWVTVLRRGGGCCAGIPSSHGFHLSRFEARKYVSNLCFSTWPVTLTSGCLDILLHQSGHIMLSDFDLAKQSAELGGLPSILHSEHNGVRSSPDLGETGFSLLVSSQGSSGRYDVLYSQLSDKLVCWD